MVKKSKYSLLLFTAPLLIFSVWFFTVCIKYKAVAFGVIILFSVIMMNALVVLIQLRQDKVIEEDKFEQTGSILKEIMCSLVCIENGISYDYNSGTLLIYEKGMDYIYDKDFHVGFVAYTDLEDVSVFDDKIDMKISSGMKKRYSIYSDKPLRIQNICSFLRNEGILDDGKEE